MIFRAFDTIGTNDQACPPKHRAHTHIAVQFTRYLPAPVMRATFESRRGMVVV